MPASRADQGALRCGYKGMRKEGKEPTMSTLSRRGFIGAGAAMAASIALVGCSSGGSSSGAPAAAGKDLRFVTGGESGTYYALGTLMAEHASTNAGLKVTAVSSGGSKANVLELEDKTLSWRFARPTSLPTRTTARRSTTSRTSPSRPSRPSRAFTRRSSTS